VAIKFRHVPLYSQFKKRGFFRSQTYIKTHYNEAKLVFLSHQDDSPLRLSNDGIIFEQEDKVVLVDGPAYNRFEHLPKGMMFWDPLGKKNLFKLNDKYGVTASGNKAIVRSDAPVFNPRYILEMKETPTAFEDLEVGEFYLYDGKVCMKMGYERSCNTLEDWGTSGTVYKLPIVNPVLSKAQEVETPKEPEKPKAQYRQTFVGSYVRGFTPDPCPSCKEAKTVSEIKPSEPTPIPYRTEVSRIINLGHTNNEITIRNYPDRVLVTMPAISSFLLEEGLEAFILTLQDSLADLKANKDKP